MQGVLGELLRGGWTDKLIHCGGLGRVDKLHSLTTRQGIREQGNTHWVRVVAALPGRQGWRCIKWPAAQHNGVDADQTVGGFC